MESKKKVVEKYENELKEIEKQMKLLIDGEICKNYLLYTIKTLIINSYYDGKSEGINFIQKIKQSIIYKLWKIDSNKWRA